MRRRACAVATVLSVSLTLVWGNPPAATQEAVPDGAIEARVGAQWLPDGRVEVALQVRTDRGAWDRSMLPRKRLMPAGSKHSRWLSTAPVALPGPRRASVARGSPRTRQGLAEGAPSTATGASACCRCDACCTQAASPASGLGPRDAGPAEGPSRRVLLAIPGYRRWEVRPCNACGGGREVTGWAERYDRLNGPRGAIGAYHLMTDVVQANPTSDGLWLYRLSHDRIGTYA